MNGRQTHILFMISFKLYSMFLHYYSSFFGYCNNLELIEDKITRNRPHCLKCSLLVVDSCMDIPLLSGSLPMTKTQCSL